MSSQFNNLATEIVFAKNAAAAATSKVTKLLNEVHSIKITNIDVINNVRDLSNQIFNIDKFISDFSYNFSDYVDNNLFNDNINRIDTSLNHIYSEFSNILSNIDLSYNLDSSFQSIVVQVNELMQNNSILNNNITFLSNQDILMKNDITYNNSLIDNNSITIYTLQQKLNNLVNILNNNLNLNINVNTL